MISDSVVFLFFALLTFFGWSFIAKAFSARFAHMHWIIGAYHDAVSFADPGVIAAFVIGLLLSVAFLVVYSRGSAPAMSRDAWQKFTLVSKRPVSKTTSMCVHADQLSLLAAQAEQPSWPPDRQAPLCARRDRRKVRHALVHTDH